MWWPFFFGFLVSSLHQIMYVDDVLVCHTGFRRQVCACLISAFFSTVYEPQRLLCFHRLSPWKCAPQEKTHLDFLQNLLSIFGILCPLVYTILIGQCWFSQVAAYLKSISSSQLSIDTLVCWLQDLGMKLLLNIILNKWWKDEECSLYTNRSHWPTLSC